MRIHEVVTTAGLKKLLESDTLYYHGSRRPFPKGFVLEPRSDGYVHGNQGDEFDVYIRKTEQILERYRPANVLSRYQSVFMTDNPGSVEDAGGRGDFIYLVRPLGPVFKSNLYWYSQIENSVISQNEDSPKYAEWARNYWLAVPSGNRETYEYRTPRAEIVKKTVFGHYRR